MCVCVCITTESCFNVELVWMKGKVPWFSQTFFIQLYCTSNWLNTSPTKFCNPWPGDFQKGCGRLLWLKIFKEVIFTTWRFYWFFFFFMCTSLVEKQIRIQFDIIKKWIIHSNINKEWQTNSIWLVKVSNENINSLYNLCGQILES